MITEAIRKPGYRTLLREVFGFEDFRPGQEQALRALHTHGAALAVFPTGAGKSLCYQLPSLNYDGVTVVVSPLIALMKDQIDYLQSKGIAAARLDSSLTTEEQHQVNRALQDGSLKLLYVAPERFNNERFLAQMHRTPIALFAIDEAHCISEWGHNFRPDYLKLAEIVVSIRAQRVLALTATATPPVVRDICNAFSIPMECAVVTGFYRSNLEILLTPTSAGERDALLLKRIKSRPSGSTIVYVTLQRTAERVAEQLASAGFEARAYHAGMEAEERTEVQEWWMASGERIVVATIAFGMGIDKADVRYIYHYNLSKGLESYSQEIGRAGRDGKPSTVEMLACSTDLPTVENFAYGDTPTREAVKGVVKAMLTSGDEFDISQYDLSAQHDLRPLVLKTLLTYLELSGVLRQGTPFYSTYRIRPEMPVDEIVGKFEGEPAELLKSIFAQSKKGVYRGTASYSLNPEVVANAIGNERRRVVRALEVLEERGFVKLSLSDVRQRYRLLRSDATVDQLVDELMARFERSEARTIQGIQRVVNLVTHAGCQTGYLAAYFGEQRDKPCGHCSYCLSGKAATMPAERKLPPIQTEVDLSELRQLRNQHGDALASTRQLARFLCGLSSPATTKARLSRHPLFGSCDHRRFHDVEDWLEEGHRL